MIVTSEVTGIRYEPDDTVKIFNQKQYTRYIKNGAQIIDTGVEDDSFYIRFSRKDHQQLFELWRNYELK